MNHRKPATWEHVAGFLLRTVGVALGFLLYWAFSIVTWIWPSLLRPDLRKSQLPVQRQKYCNRKRKQP